MMKIGVTIAIAGLMILVWCLLLETFNEFLNCSILNKIPKKGYRVGMCLILLGSAIFFTGTVIYLIKTL